MTTYDEKNVYIFSIMSFFAQMLIVILITTAQAGVSIQSPIAGQDLAQNLIGDIENKSTQVTMGETDVQNIRGSTTTGNPLDVIGTILNIPTYLGKMISVILNFGLSYLTLSFYLMSLGEFGWIAGAILGIWQLATLYYILTFIFTRLKRG